MNQQEAIKASKEYFDFYKEATELFVTSDGIGHDNKQYATDHSRRLDNQTIWPVSKEQLPGTVPTKKQKA